MSHNTPKIGTATQDRVGALGPTVEDLNDVTGAPSLNDVLKWTGTNWIPAPPPSPTQGTEVVAWVGGYFSSYGIGSWKQQGAGSFYFMALSYAAYRPLYYHDLTSATWIDSSGNQAFTTPGFLTWVELEPGTYVLKAQARVSGGVGPYVDVQWQTDAGAALGPVRRLGPATDPCHVPGRIVTTSTVKCGLMITAQASVNVSGPLAIDNQYLLISVLRIA